MAVLRQPQPIIPGCERCDNCGGTGRVPKMQPIHQAPIYGDNSKLCPKCGGTGSIRKKEQKLEETMEVTKLDNEVKSSALIKLHERVEKAFKIELSGYIIRVDVMEEGEHSRFGFYHYCGGWKLICNLNLNDYDKLIVALEEMRKHSVEAEKGDECKGCDKERGA